MGSATRAWEKRRKEERAKEDAERRREAALEAASARRQDEERARECEDERRQEALDRAREFDEAERHAAARRAQARLARRQELSNRRRSDRLEQLHALERRESTKEEDREEWRREEAHEGLRTKGRAERRALAEGERRQQESRGQARRERLAGAEEEKATKRRADEARSQRRKDARQETRDEARESEKEERRREDARAGRSAQAKDEERRAAREEEARSDRRAADREARAAEGRQAALEEQRATDRQTQRSEARRQESGHRRAAPREQRQTGDLSGALGRLSARGPYIFQDDGTPFALRGVTFLGLERAEPEGESFAPAASATSLEQARAFGASAAVVPIAQDLALVGRGDAGGEQYLAALDETIAAAAAAGLYTIVQLSSLSTAPSGADPIPEQPVPDLDSLDLWALLARRYEREQAVLFDLFRAPHDPAAGDSTAFLMPQLSYGTWHNWLRAMLGVVRREHPASVVIARAPAAHFASFPIAFTDGSTPGNVVYAVSGRDAAIDLAALSRLARTHPVALSPWHASAAARSAVERLGPVLAERGLHWTVSGWEDGDTPLVTRRGSRYEPTPLGRAFQRAMSQPLPVSAHWPAPRASLPNEDP